MKTIYWISKLFTLALTAVGLFSNGAVGIGIPSGDGRFNITSPLDHGVYVAGQVLPITYVLMRDSSRLILNIYVRPTSLDATTVTIAEKADVSTDASTIIKVNGEIHWQHSYNYKIPQTTPGGYYEVVFESVSGHVNTSIPIMIRPYTSSSANPTVYTGPSSRGPANGNPSSRNPSSDSNIKRPYIAPLAAIGSTAVVISRLLLY